MNNLTVTFRDWIGPIDADRQYSLWRRATEGLPFAWSSSMANARELAMRAATVRGSRIYAEDESGELVGYIGTHPPFIWGEMGMTVPFGFPWTAPRNPALADVLYSRMIERVGKVYAADKPRSLIQRFRSSWKEHLEFVQSRGWVEQFRKPIWAREVQATGHVPGEGRLRPFGANAMQRIAEYADMDQTLTSKPSASTIGERAAAGWFTLERCWEVPGVGAFAFDVRLPCAEVQLFHGDGARFGELVEMMDVAARAHGATTVYFTLGETETKRMEQLANAGYRAVDADVYVTKQIG